MRQGNKKYIYFEGHKTSKWVSHFKISASMNQIPSFSYFPSHFLKSNFSNIEGVPKICSTDFHRDSRGQFLGHSILVAAVFLTLE